MVSTQRTEDMSSDPERLRARIAELERENHELRRAQHFARIGSWTWNIHTDRVTWSDEMYRLYGIDEEEFSGFSADAIAASIHPDDQARAEAANRAVVEGGQPGQLEYRVIWPDGSVHVICSDSGELSEDEDGNPWILRGTAKDITQRKEAEEARRDRERWLEESQRVARLGHYVYDVENDRWSGSPWLQELFAIEPGATVGVAEWLGLVHPADRERMSQYFARDVLAHGKPFDMEYRIVRASDGAERWVHGLGTLEYAEDGHPTAMFGTIQDITSRRMIEEELRRERALLAQAESIGHIGSWRVGLHGGERRWSREAARIIGSTPSDEGDGFETLRRVVIPEHRAIFEEWLADISSSFEPRRADFRIARPDGDVRWICAHGACERDHEESTVSVAGILHDVTESKRMEQQRYGSLEEAANVDRLTGLHNVRGFEVLAEMAVAQARRAGLGVGLIFCDLDGLKSINDEFGHAQGDRALQDAASVLTYTLRSADAIARIGGDEFLVLAVGADRDAIVRLNERLKEGFDFFNATTTRPYRISLSSGIAWCEAGQRPVLDDLRSIADKAMYDEKLQRDGAVE